MSYFSRVESQTIDDKPTAIWIQGENPAAIVTDGWLEAVFPESYHTLEEGSILILNTLTLQLKIWVACTGKVWFIERVTKTGIPLPPAPPVTKQLPSRDGALKDNL